MKFTSLIPSKKLGLLAAAFFAIAPIATSHATLLAVDQFNYSSITNGLTSTGSGFTTWTSSATGTVGTGLTYSTLNTAYGSAKSAYAGKNTESLSSAITTGTVWAAFLIKNGGDSGGDSTGALLTGSTTSLFVGFAGPNDGVNNQFGLGLVTNGGGWAAPTSFVSAANISNTATHFIVLSLNLVTDSISLWIDPTVANVRNNTLGAAQSTRTLDIGNLTGFGFEGIGGQIALVDEFRLGTAAPSVVPEPHEYALVGVLLFGIAVMRRRRMLANS